MSSTDNFISFLIETNVLTFGDFTLKSGKKSPYFLDLGHVDSGVALRSLGEYFADALARHFPEATLLYGPAYKGISIASATAVAAAAKYGKDYKVLFNRKEPKGHGEGGLFIGATPSPKDKIVVLDDVTTSGGTKEEAVALLQQYFGITPTGVLVAVNRSGNESSNSIVAGVPLRWIAAVSDLVGYLRTRNPEIALKIEQGNL